MSIKFFRPWGLKCIKFFEAFEALKLKQLLYLLGPWATSGLIYRDITSEYLTFIQAHKKMIFKWWDKSLNKYFGLTSKIKDLLKLTYSIIRFVWIKSTLQSIF